jgi:hypothetical protein
MKAVFEQPPSAVKEQVTRAWGGATKVKKTMELDQI